MRRAFILFVVVHLLTDLALPTLPGAFRFDPDESVAGIRNQPVHLPGVERVAQLGGLRESLAASRLAPNLPVQSGRTGNAPDLRVLLARRDPSGGRSRQSVSEDH